MLHWPLKSVLTNFKTPCVRERQKLDFLSQINPSALAHPCPEVLQLYSPVFYNGGLEPVSRPCQDRLQGWDSSRVIAHHVVGREQQEAGSPSWFNWTEIRVVREYAESLISFGLPPSEIGVITPYVQQVQKLKQILPPDVHVGTVDAFQGSEATAIIISTVRSSDDGSLGFVTDARRINVAVSRAKAGVERTNPRILRSSFLRVSSPSASSSSLSLRRLLFSLFAIRIFLKR